MTKKKNVSKAEAARRASQSSKDKKASRSMSTVALVRQPQKKRSAGSSGVPSYAALVLDPCKAAFTQSALPGANGSTCIRCPFRQVVTVPNASTVTGGPSGTVPACDTLFAALIPHAMSTTAASPSAVAIYGAATEQAQPSFESGAFQDPQGLASLTSFVGEMRPVAACIRITCMGSDTNNTGIFFGYEGSCKSFLKHATGSDVTTQYIPGTNAQNLIFNGQTSGDTYKTFEARINYPNADEDWQQFRNSVSVPTQALAGNSRLGSFDATDPDFSGMPVAIVGVTSATTGCRYLIDGAIVYEWYPKIESGYSAPPRENSSASALKTVANYVQSVAKRAGGMLVGYAADYVTAGNANRVIGMLKSAYAAQHAGVPRIGW